MRKLLGLWAAVFFMTGMALSVPAAEGLITATTTFDAIDAEQVFTVPVGVGTVSVHAVGGTGGCAQPNPQRGGDVVATLSVIPGQLLYVEVGGNGAIGTAGFNGGGAASFLSGGGGGAS